MADRYVIDASVAAKWFLKDSFEDHVDLAEGILVDVLAGDIVLHAPRLMTYEVSRLLWKASGVSSNRVSAQVATPQRRR